MGARESRSKQALMGKATIKEPCAVTWQSTWPGHDDVAEKRNLRWMMRCLGSEYIRV